MREKTAQKTFEVSGKVSKGITGGITGGRKRKKRLGRGIGSGRGKTCGRGQKGQKSRSGKKQPYMGFEGGQMPLYLRLPKRGFKNIFRKQIEAVNLYQIDREYKSGEVVSLESLKEKGLIRKNARLAKLLGEGEITKTVVINLDRMSKSAQSKLEKIGKSVGAKVDGAKVDGVKEDRAKENKAKKDKPKEDKPKEDGELKV